MMLLNGGPKLSVTGSTLSLLYSTVASLIQSCLLIPWSFANVSFATQKADKRRYECSLQTPHRTNITLRVNRRAVF